MADDVAISMRAGTGYPYAQVWVPAGRPFAALEPMTARDEQPRRRHGAAGRAGRLLHRGVHPHDRGSTHDEGICDDEHSRNAPSVVIVGGGFAGVGCAKELAKHGVAVTLLDRHNYHQFQPLLYQVATAELSTSDIARPLRAIFNKDETVAVKQLDGDARSTRRRGR